MSRTMSVDRRGTKVIVRIREHCSVEGRTTGVEEIEMSADEARSHATHLQQSASGAEAERSRLVAESIESKRLKVAAMREEIEALEREISSAA